MMSTTIGPIPGNATTLVTADELFVRTGLGRCELLHGEIVPMSPAGAEHGEVALAVGYLLRQFVYPRRLRKVFAAETGFLIDQDPDTVLAPDASFVAAGRLSGRLPSGYFYGAPDLAVEVTSPGDTRREIADKVNMWLARDSLTVWVVEPVAQTLMVHRVGVRSRKFGVNDTITDEPVLDGFSLPIADIFPIS